MRTILLVIVAMFFPVAVFAHHLDTPNTGQHTKHYEQSLFKMTDNGLYSVEMIIKDKDLKVGVNTFDIIIHDKSDKDVAGAEIKVVPWMPDMGHGVFEKPVVIERGGGIYSVENMILIMEGRWELRLNIKKGDTEDKVTFDFQDVKRSESMSQDDYRMIHSSAPADLDTSTTRQSLKKLFRVSYASGVLPIPIGRIISWKLRVETADGHPVKNAEVTVSGGMPEHGHGLPTMPQVAESAVPGDYVLQGLKFSMPGWWVMTFKIKAQGVEDVITFNVIVP
ncbi:MAG: FixH family protein [Dissulfurispiraceae bacterium]